MSTYEEFMIILNAVSYTHLDVYKRQVLGYGIQFLLPCIIGVIAAMLFFMERDNDTFKNLRTIPVTSTQMVLAKIFVLFLFGIIFCVASTIATILCGLGTLEVYGLGYKLFLAVETGIFITAGTLPLIVLVVFFSKTYLLLFPVTQLSLCYELPSELSPSL